MHADWKAEVLQVEALRAKALVDADVVTLERITSVDYVHVESSGRVRTKKQFLTGLMEAEYRFDSFVIDENHVRIFGETAIVTGSYHTAIRTAAGLQATKFARHIRVYVRLMGGWLNVAHQATEMTSA